MASVTRFYSLLGLLALTLLMGCSSTDLALVNDVKRFEPEWMDISEQVSDIDANFKRAQYTFETFFNFASPQLEDNEVAREAGLYSARSQYRTLMAERDRLEDIFARQKGRFVESVQAFNQWQNKLMKGDLDELLARNDFLQYQEAYQELADDISQTQRDLEGTIDESNQLVRRICSKISEVPCDEYVIDTRH